MKHGLLAVALAVLGAAAPRESVQLETGKLMWTRVDVAGLPKGLKSKSLHNDPKGPSSSALIRYPRGYREPRHYHETCTHTIYVLKGRLKTPDGELTPGTFLFSAKGERHGPIVALEESEILFHTQGPFDFLVDDPEAKK
ncbi:MAG TPA: cupin domain-containing protein [Bryobacteraceae bacterium]|jgi:quercetin dioxygenase-like cupin family protein|nr:cupin domain-containing protein [Bryobacteraceae bacterium]